MSSYIHFRIDEPINNLRLFCNVTEDFLDKLHQEVDSIAPADEDYFDWLNKSLKYSFDLPMILRHSLVVSLYSYFENQLTLLCKSIQFHNNIMLSVTDIKGSGLERAQIYLKKIVNLTFPNSKEWQFINRCSLIRNCIVHCSGDVDSFSHRNQLIKLIEGSPDIIVALDNKLIINKEFSNKLMHCMELYLKILYKNANEMELL